MAFAPIQVKFKSRTNAQLLEGSLYNHIEGLWNKTRVDMAKGNYKPLLDPALEACIHKQTGLDWWTEP